MLHRFAAVTVLLAGLAVALGQQDKPLKEGIKKDKDKPAEPAVVVVSKSLLKGWSKLDLTAKQKEEIYRVRAAYATKREALQKQMAALKQEEAAALNAVLTDAQRQRLQELQKPASK